MINLSYKMYLLLKLQKTPRLNDYIKTGHVYINLPEGG